METIIVCAALSLICILIVVHLVKNRKKGCGGGCAGCAFSENCHSKK